MVCPLQPFYLDRSNSFRRGGAIVWRVALFYPDLVKQVFAICTPYPPPRKDYLPLEDVVKMAPNFRYQLQLASGIVGEKLNTPEKYRQLLNSLYNGSGPNKEPGFTTKDGIIFENLPLIGPSPLLSSEVC